MVMLSHFATNCSLLPTIIEDLRFGIKFIFSSKIEIIDGCKGLNSGHGSTTQNSVPILLPFVT
jgi:hypothetical protein